MEFLSIIATEWEIEENFLILIAKVVRNQAEVVAESPREEHDVPGLVAVMMVVEEILSISKLRVLSA